MDSAPLFPDQFCPGDFVIMSKRGVPTPPPHSHNKLCSKIQLDENDCCFLDAQAAVVMTASARTSVSGKMKYHDRCLMIYFF